ncbi:hypothetical protein BC943DRAFT_185169 [Umbelopsis sp. AD052]|nr:hypothetical protein BC943DRAFT_185169 [Umbelopsis sp. AD052]
MSDENKSSKTRIEEDLVIDIGHGSDLVATTELQADVLTNDEASRPTSVYSDNDKTVGLASDNRLKCAEKDVASISPSHTSTMESAKAKKAWWRGRSSNMDIDPKTYTSRKKISITAVIALAGSISPISSTIYYPALVTVQEELNTTATAVNASRKYQY